MTYQLSEGKAGKSEGEEFKDNSSPESQREVPEVSSWGTAHKRSPEKL